MRRRASEGKQRLAFWPQQAQTGKYTLLYSFKGGSDGLQPEANVIYLPGADGAAGVLYRTASGGGNGNETLWQLSAAGVLTVLHTFCESAVCPDGSNPGYVPFNATETGKPIAGVTSGGGENGKGVVYQYDLPRVRSGALQIARARRARWEEKSQAPLKSRRPEHVVKVGSFLL